MILSETYENIRKNKIIFGSKFPKTVEMVFKMNDKLLVVMKSGTSVNFIVMESLWNIMAIMKGV